MRKLKSLPNGTAKFDSVDITIDLFDCFDFGYYLAATKNTEKSQQVMKQGLERTQKYSEPKDYRIELNDPKSSTIALNDLADPKAVYVPFCHVTVYPS